MPSYLMVAENKISLLGPLYSVYQEEAVLKSFSTIADVLEMSAIPLGFISNFDSFNPERMQVVSPKTLLSKALELTDDLEKDFEEDWTKSKSPHLTKKIKQSKKLLEESQEVRDNIGENLKDILQVKIEALQKIKEAYASIGLFD